MPPEQPNIEQPVPPPKEAAPVAEAEVFEEEEPLDEEALAELRERLSETPFG